MSPICQTFVQNAWRKDLCSNCFKSEEEHGNPQSDYDYALRRNYSSEGTTLGKRYVGVGGRSGLYSRSYYGNSTWNSKMLDNSSNDSRSLKSPGLIRGMDSIIKQENEKNRQWPDLGIGRGNDDLKEDYDISKSSVPKDSWILSHIIKETKPLKSNERSERLHGDSSSDLGSDASHDSSLSSGNMSGSSEGDSKGDSDASSVKSEPDSAHEEEEVEETLQGILKTVHSFQRKLKNGISFNDEQDVIGYGGDIDYSDDEEEYENDDDDDDDISVSSLDLSSEDKYLRYLTERNTNFNSENSNLEKDLPLEQKSEICHPSDYSFSTKDLCNYNVLNKLDKQEDVANKQDVKVKLKRSQPILGSKPLIKQNFNLSYADNLLDALNFQITNNDRERVPLQGIKPKFVSRENEMQENTQFDDMYSPEVPNMECEDSSTKVTLIDDVSFKKDNLKLEFASTESALGSAKFTSIDDFITIENFDNNKLDSSEDSTKNLSDVTTIENFDNNKLDSNEDSTKNLSDVTTRKTKSINHKKTTKITDIDNCMKGTYIEDVLAYDYHSSDSLEKATTNISSSRKFNDEKATYQLPDNYVDATSGVNDTDYSVKSGEVSVADFKAKQINQGQIESVNGIEQSLKEIENSKENLEKLNSGVIPMNMITIQRRSSFMESQLGNSVFSIDKPSQKVSVSGSIADVTNKKISEKSSYTKANNIAQKKCRDSLTDSKTDQGNTNEDKVDNVNTNGNQFLGPNKVSRSKNILNKNKGEEKDSFDYNSGIQTTHSNPITNGFSLESKVPFESSPKCQRKETQPIAVVSSRNEVDTLEEINALLEKKENSVKTSQTFSTFGTPAISASAPNSSFLHSGNIQPVTQSSEINSIINSTSAFLRDIKPRCDQPAVTASIQKSAIYASLSSLNGVSLAKPAITPKPNHLKEKTKITTKSVNSSCVPNRRVGVATYNTNVHLNNYNIENSASNANVRDFNTESKEQDSKVHSYLKNGGAYGDEVVYDLPVTTSTTSVTSSIPSPSSCSSSSGYSTSNISQSSDNVAYRETNVSNEDKTLPKINVSQDENIALGISDRDIYRAKFEATRNILSKTLSFENKPLVSECQLEQNTETVEQKPIIQYSENLPLPNTQLNYNINNTETDQQDCNDYAAYPSCYDSQDIDSYSSFTDDFDDDDEDDEDDDEITNNKSHFLNTRPDVPPLRRNDRSSSALPSFRNSVGPVNFSSTDISGIASLQNAFCPPFSNKQPATRSQSVPRSNDIVINPSGVMLKNKQDSSSRFGGFVKSGFFRPSSPPVSKFKSFSSERGRDRTKRSSQSVTFFKKLLKFGSGEKFTRNTKDEKTQKHQDKETDREARKKKLQIIHPLDYNTNGVEVISRPEKKSPTYDFSGIADPLLQEALRQHSEAMSAKVASEAPMPKDICSSEENSSSNKKRSSLRKVTKNNSFLKKRKKTERNHSDRGGMHSSVTYVREPETQRTPHNTANDVAPQRVSCVNDNKSNEFSQNSSSTTGINNTNGSTSHLGFNSEGRPKPPPPPRKTSLESNGGTFQDTLRLKSNPRRHSSIDTTNLLSMLSNNESNKTEGDNSSLSSNCSSTRPHRPPPPRRTPSNLIRGQGVDIRLKDSVYANLGNARASFTPRKPGRTSSIRDEEREKRPAPLPPQVTNQLKAQQVNEQRENGLPPPSSNREKSKQRGIRRGSVVTNLSLEDQYGAVVSANLEALSNMLDQMCSYSDSKIYQRVQQQVSRYSHLTVNSEDTVSCGSKVFFPAVAANCNVTVMVSTEAKIENDTMSLLVPIVSFKDDIPVSFWSDDSLDKSFVTGSVWVLPRMKISFLEDYIHSSQSLLEENPSEWERRVALFLLQLVSALKQLQAKGIEETSMESLLVVTQPASDDNPRLLMMENESSNGKGVSNGAKDDVEFLMSLCHCAAAVIQLMLGNSQPVEAAMKGPVLCPAPVPSPHAFSGLVSILREERSNSLTKAKCILEAMLYGPEDSLVSSKTDIESALQKWLDLERANVLHSLVREQAAGSFDKSCFSTKFHVVFLVRTSVKILSESMKSLEAPDVTDF